MAVMYLMTTNGTVAKCSLGIYTCFTGYRGNLSLRQFLAANDGTEEFAAYTRIESRLELQSTAESTLK